ncbi:MAG TPA: multiheme c-type cytochrome [Thermoanaerobaculia bacterium]|nr:multiheme c-type cytochrome [Thermoanaerobaculia bacterium]
MKPTRHLAPWTAAAVLAAALGSTPVPGATRAAGAGAALPQAPPAAATKPEPAPGGSGTSGTAAAPQGPAAATGTGGAPGAATPQPASAAAGVAPPEKGFYFGPTSCGSSSCHGSVTPRRTFGVRQDEYFIWQKKDRHAQAYGVLFNDRSRLIARRLHLGEAADSPACRSCHALAVPARLQRGPLELEDGISCEGCHGAAGGWLEGHRSESWTHQQSVAAGMTDLRDVQARAAVCLACHLGGPGKTVNHDLIAAGHPQLAFELDNYSEGMPAHWLPFADRPAGQSDRDTHGTRAWAVGQAAGLSADLEQIARRARGGNLRDESTPWPEFSQLSCDSCHHSLAQERWRTAPDRPGRPGLPRISPARYAILRHLVAAVAPERQAALEGGVEQLTAVLSRLGTPPAEVAAAAERLGRETAEIAPRLDRRRWDDALARRLLLAVAQNEGGLETADYASAQQAALAVQTLVSQLLASEPRRLRSGLAGAAEGLAAELQNPYSFDPGRFAERLAQLARQLREAP